MSMWAYEALGLGVGLDLLALHSHCESTEAGELVQRAELALGEEVSYLLIGLTILDVNETVCNALFEVLELDRVVLRLLQSNVLEDGGDADLRVTVD